MVQPLHHLRHQRSRKPSASGPSVSGPSASGPSSPRSLLPAIAAIGLLLTGLWGTSVAQAQPSDSTLQDRAQAALDARQYETAIPLWQAIVRQHPDDANAYYSLGLSLHAQDRLDEAITAYETAIRLNPQYDAPYVNLGLILISLGNLEGAKSRFQQVLQLPDRPEVPASIHTIAHYNLAIIEKRTDHPDAALTEVQQALAITPDFARAQQLLEQLRSGRREKERSEEGRRE